ncbi:MAG: hypothetical protein HUJ63_09075 [Enterococcus sp.]|nr:hypothetical protein [Enterococcus sp.]
MKADSPFGREMQAAYSALATRAYAKIPIALPTGETVDAGTFFSGDGYKRYQSDVVTRSAFSTAVRDAVKGEDGDLAGVVGLAVGPVVEFAAGQKGTGRLHPERTELSAIADYVVANYSSLKESLGVDGLRHLVADAVDRRAKLGGAVDFMAAAAEVASAGANGGQAGLQGVRRVLSSYDRMARSLAGDGNTSGALPPAMDRLLMRTMVAAAKSGAAVDFSNPAVVAGMQNLMGVVNAYERMRVPVVGKAAAGGADVTNALAGALAGFADGNGVDENNLFYQLSSLLDLSAGLMSGGMGRAKRDASADPSVHAGPSGVLAATSGDGNVDAAVARMTATVLRNAVQSVANGHSAVDAVRKLKLNPNEDGSIVGEWANDIDATTGLGLGVSRAVAARAARHVYNDGSLRQFDLMGTLRGMALDSDYKKAAPDDYKKVMRFLKAHGQVGTVLAPKMAEYEAMMSHPLTGGFPGKGGDSARKAMVAKALMAATDIAETGRDPTSYIAGLMNHGRALVPVPGVFVDPNGAVGTLDELVKASMVRGGNEIARYKASLLPMVREYRGDLTRVDDPGAPGWTPKIPYGSFGNSAGRDMFWANQARYRELLDAIDARRKAVATRKLDDPDS